MQITIQKGLKMNNFKIGDKVKFKQNEEYLGFVSHINKGQLFLLDDPEIDIHLGLGVHQIRNASELEIYTNE
jgi:hypothetical protein